MQLWFLFVLLGTLSHAAREPTPMTDQFLASQRQQGVKNPDQVTRVWHMAYIQDPDMSKKKQKKLFTKRRDVVITDLNNAMDFHEIPMRFEAGNTYIQSSKLWLNPPFGGKDGDPVSRKCGLSLKLCSKWFDDEGVREEGVPSLDLFFCVFPDWYYAGCAGLAQRTGDTAFVGMDGFLDADLIGIHHEVGHNLGCEHMTHFCSPDFKKFHHSTHMIVKTLMGGGAACPVEDEDEVKRLKYYTDAEKEFCETPNSCLVLGDENADCAGVILRNLEKDVASLPKTTCSRKKVADYRGPFCVLEPEATCQDATRLFKGDPAVVTYLDCAAAIVDNPELCPTGIFSFFALFSSSGERRPYCMCCPKKRYTAESKKISMLYKIVTDESSVAVDDVTVSEAQAWRNSELQQPSPFMNQGLIYVLATVGFSSLLWFGTKIMGRKERQQQVLEAEDV